MTYISDDLTEGDMEVKDNAGTLIRLILLAEREARFLGVYIENEVQTIIEKLRAVHDKK